MLLAQINYSYADAILFPHIHTHDNHTYFGFIQLSRQINYTIFTLIALILSKKYTVSIIATITTIAIHHHRTTTIYCRLQYAIGKRCGM